LPSGQIYRYNRELDMPDKNLGNLLKLYNPWWDDHSSRWRETLPDYQRPVVSEVLSDIRELTQIISMKIIGGSVSESNRPCRFVAGNTGFEGHKIRF